MRRLAPVLVAAVLALGARRAAAEPYDVDLSRLGAPDPDVWKTIQGLPLTTVDPLSDALARESRQRFAVLSSEVALALSSAILEPASTVGHSQFDFDMEAAYAGVHPAPVGTTTLPGYFDDPVTWPTRSRTPQDLFMPSLHMRKALPFSFEMGGRLTYLSMTSYYAAQGEAKWALNEGFEYIPDLAVRVAYTRLFGQKDWNLGATDLDFMVSKRWGVMGVTSFTPYLAARFTFVSASTKRIEFPSPTGTPPTDPGSVEHMSAAFPDLHAGFYRTTVGLRFTAYAVSLAAEATYFAGTKYSGKDAVDAYPDFKLASSLGGAFKLGWEF